MQKIILASASPRRRELLGGLGLGFESVVSGIEETPLDGETPTEHALRLSREKALAVAADPDDLIIGADTIVIIDGEVLGKPKDITEAGQMLRKLSGRLHRVITAFALVRGQAVLANQAVESSVIFKEISAAELDWYVQTQEPYDKAGGYAVQGISAFFIREIHGSYTNVMGLPLAELMDALENCGAFRLEDLKVERR